MKLAKEMRELSELELNEKVSDLKQELFNLRFQHAVNQLENPQRIKAVKKHIAIIKTIQRERELSTSAGSTRASAAN
ncbi:MAG: 50S ribosomal protein L29 [Oscillospiraceae bacterium]|nr:50S ribosomal protein L29 [Oscillospiraceae bacterium]